MNAEQLVKRYEAAKRRRDTWLPQWEDCYDYAFPGRDSFYGETPGESRLEELYDDTAVGAVQDFASMLVEGLFAGNFLRLEPGPEVPPADRDEFQKALDEVMAEVMGVIRNSNFAEQAHEAIQDLSIGTAAMVINPSQDHHIVKTMAVPLHQMTFDRGPFGEVDGVFRSRKIPIHHLKVLWPKAEIPEELTRQQDMSTYSTSQQGADVDIIECCYRDWSNPAKERYVYQVVARKLKVTLLERDYSGMGSKPWVTPRWSTASGEIYGRGPLLNTLNSVRGINLVKKLVFENADLAIGGVWSIEHDGVINPDTISIESGIVIPHMPGSRGLQAVQSPSNFDISQFVFSEEKDAIRRALYVEDYQGQGKTPISAEEVDARRQMLMRRIGAPFMRLFNEFVVPVVRRVMYLMKEDGIIDIPRVDGRAITPIAASPLARAARMDDVQRAVYFNGITQQLGGGPQAAAMYLNVQKTLRRVALMLEQPLEELKTEDEVRAAMQQMAQMMEASGGA